MGDSVPTERPRRTAQHASGPPPPTAPTDVALHKAEQSLARAQKKVDAARLAAAADRGGGAPAPSHVSEADEGLNQAGHGPHPPQGPPPRAPMATTPPPPVLALHATQGAVVCKNIDRVLPPAHRAHTGGFPPTADASPIPGTLLISLGPEIAGLLNAHAQIAALATAGGCRSSCAGPVHAAAASVETAAPTLFLTD